MADNTSLFGETIVAIATGAGAGGIAVVRLSGTQSYNIAQKVFAPQNPNKKVVDAKGYTALFGQFMRDTESIDEGIALFFRAPHSYTGEDVVELSCHGGNTVAKLLVEACINAGAVPAGAGEYTRRAFLNGKLDLTRAEAVLDIISANSRQGAALAKTALSGALAKKMAMAQNKLLDLQVHLAAYVDYPEEDVPALEDSVVLQTLAEIRAELNALIANYDAGAILRTGVDTAILGRPNAGKSTLLNLLAGFDRAIVTPVAGTTRDVVEQAVQLGEIQLNLFDTAGLRDTGDAIEAEGIRRSWQKLDEAGLILAVFDSAEDWTAEDSALAEQCKNRHAIAILNKTDLTPKFDADRLNNYFKVVLAVSCKEEGAKEIIADAVETFLQTKTVDTHAASLSGRRQLSAAKRAEDAISEAITAMESGLGLDALSVCVDDALDALFALTGENASETVIHEIFERFCVGK